MKIGLCTGGGDCPGLNSIIRASVRHGVLNYQDEIWGIRDSFNGLMEKPYRVRKLDQESVSGILMRGGTILGTTNAGNPFDRPDGKGHAIDKSQMVVDAYNELGFDCILAIGGDGTHTIAHQLSQKGIKIIGIPKTIDNDLWQTDETVGFDTAVAIAEDAISRLQTTAESHERVMILEVMGRHTGHIALSAGLAAGAHIILIPEIPFDFEKIAAKVRLRQQREKHFTVIVVAEGAFAAGGEQTYQKVANNKETLGGVGHLIARELNHRYQFETRVTVLGHIQRGGMPTHVDRILGTLYGVKAIDMAHQGRFGKIIHKWKGSFGELSYQDVAGKYRNVEAQSDTLAAARSIGICFGD